MGRQSGDDPTAMLSSIALLQERFRRLEKVKEMREEKEVLKLFPVSERIKSTMNQELVFHPTAPAQRSSLFFQPDLRSNRAVETPKLMSMDSWDPWMMNYLSSRERTEVDTSLRL